MKRTDLLDKAQLSNLPESQTEDLEFIDFTRNPGAMSQSVESGVVKLCCEGSDFNLAGFNRLGIIAKCPKGFIIFSFQKYDYNGSGEDREIAGARYISTNGQFTLLIIND